MGTTTIYFSPFIWPYLISYRNVLRSYVGTTTVYFDPLI